MSFRLELPKDDLIRGGEGVDRDFCFGLGTCHFPKTHGKWSMAPKGMDGFPSTFRPFLFRSSFGTSD